MFTVELPVDLEQSVCVARLSAAVLNNVENVFYGGSHLGREKVSPIQAMHTLIKEHS